MSQSATENKEFLSLLKINDKGWNIKIFEDETKAEALMCAYCGGVCCDAVELGCDHDDIDILLYCNYCLTELIKKNNNNKCPINNHLNPIILSSRVCRNDILKLNILCPYSIQYKKKCINHDIDDRNIEDEKEGFQTQKDNKIKGCEWHGTFSQLLKHNHLTTC